MSPDDAVLMGTVAVLAVLASLLFLKEFRAVCFDQEFSAAQGWPVGLIDIVMMGFVVLVTVIGLQAVGLVLVVAMVIIPAAAARFWTERLGVMVCASACIGGASGYLGALVSAATPRMPAGAVIVLVAGVLFLVSLLSAPRRGLIADIRRRGTLRRSVRIQHALRAWHELLETRMAGANEPVSVQRFAHWIERPQVQAQRLARMLQRRGFARRTPDGWVLTDRGLSDARRITRNHRLWEAYLQAYADVAPNHVDFGADRVEHVLSSRLVRELERSLIDRGIAVLSDEPPRSVHPLRAQEERA